MTNLFKKELFAFFILLSFHFSWVHSFFMIKLDGMTLANILTLFRILILFPFIGMFYIDAHWANGVAVVLYLTACFTDYLDGMVARGFNHVSTFGKFLDPIADKLLIATTIIMLAGTGRLEGTALLPALIILGRMISLSYLLADGPKKYVWGFQEVGVVLLWTAALLSLISGYEYWRKGRSIINP